MCYVLMNNEGIKYFVLLNNEGIQCIMWYWIMKEKNVVCAIE